MFNDARRSSMVVSDPFRELGIERPRGQRDMRQRSCRFGPAGP
jgi:hypothetical protein